MNLNRQLFFCSHYDTEEFSLGVNDNLSDVATCLEISRILAQLSKQPHIIGNFITLEEGHPVLNKKLRDAASKYSIMSSSFRYTKEKYLDSQFCHKK